MRAALPMALALALTLACAGGAAAADLPPLPFVSTTGKAQTWIAPDIAVLYFETGAQHVSAEQAGAELGELSGAIAELLAVHGVADADIDGSQLAKKTVNLSSRTPDGSTSAYVLTRHYRVQVRDLGHLPDLVTALLARDHVDSLTASFDRTDKDRIERALMEQAAADARANGALLAQSFGRQLGPAVAIARAPLDKVVPPLLDPAGPGTAALPAAQPIHAYTVPPALPFAQAVTAVFRLREVAGSRDGATRRR